MRSKTLLAKPTSREANLPRERLVARIAQSPEKNSIFLSTKLKNSLSDVDCAFSFARDTDCAAAADAYNQSGSFAASTLANKGADARLSRYMATSDRLLLLEIVACRMSDSGVKIKTSRLRSMGGALNQRRALFHMPARCWRWSRALWRCFWRWRSDQAKLFAVRS